MRCSYECGEQLHAAKLTERVRRFLATRALNFQYDLGRALDGACPIPNCKPNELSLSKRHVKIGGPGLQRIDHRHFRVFIFQIGGHVFALQLSSAVTIPEPFEWIALKLLSQFVIIVFPSRFFQCVDTVQG